MTEQSTGGLSIGTVVERLRGEFPDLSISKVRFLEGKGLLKPTRTGSGYRYFTESDVERLLYILRAQRDQFWPLKVIRENLDALDRGLTASAGGGAQPARASVPRPERDPAVPSAEELLPASTGLRLTAAELRQASGLDESQLSSLIGYGLVTADRDGHFDDGDLAVAIQAAALAGYGIEARHLRPFRMAADRELGLIAQASAPIAGRHGRSAESVHADILSHCIGLHVALVRAGLREL